jgi:pimeloyl-ACP methyl ester carboxylesterase
MNLILNTCINKYLSLVLQKKFNIKMRTYSIAPDYKRGHKPDPSLYRKPPDPELVYVTVQTGFTGYIPENEYDLKSSYIKTNVFEISALLYGDKGPVVLFLHGVPTNKYEWIEIQKMMSPFCRTVSIDMLGMGESSKPRYYGIDELGYFAWEWKNDVEYIDQVMTALFSKEPFLFVASDWDGGIATHYSEKYSNRLTGLVLVDPIALDGYPVPEIQAFGRSSLVDDDTYIKLLSSSDQTIA